jgi:hypothetical protein
MPGLYLALLLCLLALALRRWWDPVPVRVWAAFGALLIVLFGPALFLGRVLLPVDILPGVRTLEEVGAPPRGNTLQMDLVTQIVPWEAEVRRAVKAGMWPAWNPDSGAGMPLLADPQSQALQPLVLAGLPLPLAQAIGVTAGLKVAVALVFFFLLLRRQGLSEGPALFGSLSYGLGGFLLLWLGWPLATAAALLPLVLYALAVTADRGARRDFGLLVAALFSLLLAGHPETVLYVAIAGGLFAAARLFQRERDKRVQLLLRWALAGAIACGLAAPALVPMARFLPQSFRTGRVAVRNTRVERRGALGGWRTPEERRRSLRSLEERSVPLFAPNAFGNSRYGGYWGESNSNEDATGFVGGAALLAALLAFLPARRRLPQERLFLGLALVSLAVTVGVPGVPRLLAALPVLNQSISGHRRLLLLLAFSLSYLAACTLERWRAGEVRRPAVAGASLLLLDLIAWGYLGSPPPAGNEGIASLRAFWLGLQLATVALAAAALLWKRAGMNAFLLVLASAELIAIHRPANPSLPRSGFYPTTPSIAFLQEHAAGSRIAGLADRLLPNSASVYGLADIRVSNPFKPALYAAAVAPVSASATTTEQILMKPEHPLYQLLGVRWIVAPPRFKGYPGVRAVFRDSTARIFEREKVLPLLFLPESTEGPGAVPWASWIAANPDFAARALVDPAPGRPEAWTASRPGESAVEILALQPARLSSRALLAEDRLLASSVYQDGGWHLLLDGRPVPTVRANGPFLAAWLPAGEHRVEAIYRAPGLMPGLALAALAWTALIGWLARPARATRSRA